jgi:phage tail-like protein
MTGDAIQAVTPVAPAPRAHYPAPHARGTFSRYILDLPVVYHDNEFLGRFLNIFESIWEPLEQRQDHADMYFDPRTCPVEFLPWLASWFDLSLDPEWPETQRRALLLEAFDLYRWQGTRYGLQRIIELRTGLSPEILDEPGLPFVVRIRAHLTPESGITRQMLADVIDTHKPAHVGYILELRS